MHTRVDPGGDGSEAVRAVVGRIRTDFFRRIGLDSPLSAGNSR
ncbi:short-chain dehydrogenase/reductase [Streptomyces sp. NPDC046870]